MEPRRAGQRGIALGREGAGLTCFQTYEKAASCDVLAPGRDFVGRSEPAESLFSDSQVRFLALRLALRFVLHWCGSGSRGVKVTFQRHTTSPSSRPCCTVSRGGGGTEHHEEAPVAWLNQKHALCGFE